MSVVSTTKDINGSPEDVRRVLLDFDNIPNWTQGFIRSIKAVTNKSTIDVGDKLNVTLENASFSPVVLENSPEQFKWRGSIPFLLNGDHTFRFDPGPTPGTTRLTHSEHFTGPLSFVMKLIPQGTKQKDGFDGFNSDLKKRVENGNRL